MLFLYKKLLLKFLIEYTNKKEILNIINFLINEAFKYMHFKFNDAV